MAFFFLCGSDFKLELSRLFYLVCRCALLHEETVCVLMMRGVVYKLHKTNGYFLVTLL